MRFVFFLLTLYAFTGCGTIEIKSTPPEAEVYLYIPGKGEPKNIGKTPINEKVGKLSDWVNQGTIILTIKKQGFLEQSYIVPNLSQGDLKIQATLKTYASSEYKHINQIIALSFKAERLIIEKRLKEAIEVIKKIKELDENVAVAYQLMGTVLFLQKNLKDSRFEWVRSLELEPNNPESEKMLALINEKLKAGGN